MSVRIHPTALVDNGACLGRDVEVGAFSIVGPRVVLGDGCKLHHHVTVEGRTTLGSGCEVFPQAVLGLPPQDVKYAGEDTALEIGARNVFREMATVHPGTGNGGGSTSIGDDNLFLIGIHVAHDCHIGSHCIFANYVQFAGHIRVEDHVNMGGHSAVHHFVTIGKHAFVGGMTRVTADVPPYVIVVAARGSRSEIRMINGVGLQRSGYSHDDIAALKGAFMKLFSRRARMNGTAIRDRVQTILDTQPLNPHVEYLCQSLMRSFAHGRHGRYLESLRADPVHRDSWKVESQARVTVKVEGRGTVEQARMLDSGQPGRLIRLTASPDPGWSFAGWNGSASELTVSKTLVVDENETVTATFAPAG